MRLTHLEAFRPICILCRKAGASQALRLADAEPDAGGSVRWGVLGCPACGMEYPIVDGVPILVPRVRDYVARFLDQIMMRSDVPASIESLLGDAAGPGSTLDAVRQTLSSYVWDHYGDCDPQERGPGLPNGAAPGAVRACLQAGLALLPDVPAGLAIDLGCGPGRSTFGLAAASPGLVLGIDLNPPLMRIAATILRDRRVRYPRRRIGLVYDRRDFAVSLPGAERVDFWIADATDLPVADGSCALATGFNLLDCLGNPAEGLAAIGRVLADGGTAMLASPYDWSAAATPVENWIGGHSQRGPHQGAAEPLLRSLLNGGAEPASGLDIVAENPALPWQVRLHDRSVMTYETHLVVASRRPRI